MAYEKPVWVESFPAAADYSAAGNQYKFVKLNANGEAEICSATTDEVLGVLQNRPNNAKGQLAEVMIVGISKVSSDAALAVGDVIGTSADGEAAVYVHGVDNTKYLVGKVVLASAAAHGYASALINCLACGRGA